MKQWFVPQDSIVRRIWGDADIVLLIFAGAAAEFALNRAVDWLFFTNNLPNDPIGRFFSTIGYAQKIVFAEHQQALQALEQINHVHSSVERSRNARIPEWAYRDVLYLLIDYSERAFALAHRPLTTAEKEDLFDTFRRVGEALHVTALPRSYAEWQEDRRLHLENDLQYSEHTAALYASYRRDLGRWRFTLLIHLQAVLVPVIVRDLLDLPKVSWLRPIFWVYPLVERLGLHSFYQRILIPREHFRAVQQLHLLPRN